MNRSNRDRLVASLSGLAVAAQALIVLYILPVTAALLTALFAFVVPLYSYLAAVTMGVIGLVGFALFAVSGVVVLLWIYRAHDNLARFGMPGLTYSPGWAAGSFLVPFANLVIPFRAMRELWNRSHGEDEWQARGDVTDVSAWWACLLASTFLQAIQYFVLAVNLLTNLEFITPPGIAAIMAVLGQVLSLGAAVFLFRIIAAVTRAQKTDSGVGNAFA